jgi:heat shock protein HslJ
MGKVILAGLLGAAAAAAPTFAREPLGTLEGAQWRLRTLAEMDERALAAVPRALSARFLGGRVEGFSGCNGFTGAYTVEGDRLTVAQLAGTMMACPEPQMKIESAFRAAFVGTSRFSLAGGRLTIAGANGTTLVFESEPSLPLEAVRWEITGLDNGKGGMASPLAGTQLSLQLRGGTASGHAGCNGYRAGYVVDGNRLTVSGAAATRKACPQEGVMAQEQQFLAALQSAATWAVRGDLLEIRRADGARVIAARGRAE